jgi:hypothetical protein
MKGRIALAGLTALLFMGASWELNPLVTRLAKPGPVPPGCDEALAPAAAPRVNVAEIPERETIVPVSMPPAAPPSRSLREELESAHRALVRNDRPAFDEHLRAARSVVATYPTGGEKSRAEEVLWALNDAAVLWDAQFASPFFDETSDAYTRASRYAGYADAMRRSVFTDRSQRRFYPAAESRDFVARVAAERLQRLGVRGAAAPPPRVTRRSEERAVPSPPRVAARRHSSSPTTRKTRKPAALAKAPPSSSPDPSDTPPPPAPAEPAPTAPPASAPSRTASADAPASPVAEDVPVPMATDSATTTSAPVSPEPAPTSTAAIPAERRSVIIPALLILVGLGVLVVLFKASK